MSAAGTTVEPTETVLVECVDFIGGGDDPRDVLTHLVELVYRPDRRGGVRRVLVEMRYDLAPDGSRLLVDIETVHDTADLTRRRSTVGGQVTPDLAPDNAQPTEETHR